MYYDKYVYCKKCGWHKVSAYIDHPGVCPVCKESVEPVPEKYIDEFDLFKSEEMEKQFIEECVKSSPKFDPYLFEHWEEIYNEHVQSNARAAALGEALLKGTDKGNSYGIKCPYCNATNVQKIGFLSRSLSTGLFGIGSGKIGKQWHCTHCGSDF